jgi:Uma2 family endonuclease
MKTAFRMSTLGGTALTTWEDFLGLSSEDGIDRYELHDGEVIQVAPPRPIHIYIQSVLTEWLTSAARGRGRAAQEFPYRPATNLQFWRADVAYLPAEDWQRMRTDEYPVYAPPLIIEILSPSNKSTSIDRQRVCAFSAGTREFWVVDPIEQSIEVSMPGEPSRVYRIGESVPVRVLPDAVLPIHRLFQS